MKQEDKEKENEGLQKKKTRWAFLGAKKSSMKLFFTKKIVDWEEPEE